MSISGLTLRQLRYFVAVAEAMSFRRAAERLHVSQPPLTQQVRAIEELLQVKLLDRSRRRIELTHVGVSFLADARKILFDVERTCAAARAASRGLAGELRVGLSEDVIHSPSFARVMEFARSHVKIRLSTRVELSVNLIGQLRAEAVDVVVGNLPITAEGGGLKHLALPSSAIVALIPPGHRLCGRDVIAPADLEGEPLILPPGDTCAWFTSVSDVVFEAAGIVPFVVHYTATTNVAARLAAQSMGIALTSQYSIDPQTDRVHVAELAAPRARLQHALFWRERNASKAIERLVEFMESSPA